MGDPHKVSKACPSGELLLDFINRREQFVCQSKWAIAVGNATFGGRDQFAVVIEDDKFDYRDMEDGPQKEYYQNFHIPCPNKRVAETIVRDHNEGLE